MIRQRSLINHRTRRLCSGQCVKSIAEHFQVWHRNHRTRRQLGRLNDHQLPDLGLTAIDRRIECLKWFWQA